MRLKTAIIEKECIKRSKKLILDGPKYLCPLIEAIDVLSESEMIFATEPEKLLQIHACLANSFADTFGKWTKLPNLISLPVKTYVKTL